MSLVPEVSSATTQPGDDVYLGSTIAKLHLWGIVSDLDTPAMMSGSLEVLGDEAALVLDALVGPRGPAGQNAPIVKMQWSTSIRDPNDLPKNLLNDPNDIGKAWWIGNQVYCWDGFRFQIHAMGTQGAAGPVPRITPTFEIIDKNNLDDPGGIDVTGTTTHPNWHHRIPGRYIIGPPGPSAAIHNADDYDDSEPAEPLKVLTAVEGTTPGSILWGPRNFMRRETRYYTVPEGTFTNFIGITSGHVICQYDIEPQPYDYVPYVHGHIKAWGLGESMLNMAIGVEVRLDDPAGGPLIARGHGNSALWSTLSPHFSDPGNPMAATSPTNQVGMVLAGYPGKLFVRLVAEGIPGTYIYDKAGSQLSILTVAQDAGVPSMQSETFTTPGLTVYRIPSWCNFIEAVLLGGGGGSMGGSGMQGGRGGGAGVWGAYTIERGATIPRETTQLLLNVGDGGIAGPFESGSSQYPAGNGQSTTIEGNGMVTLQALGGLYAGQPALVQWGKGPGNHVWQGRTYVGGKDRTDVVSPGNGKPGYAPGGGAAGAGWQAIAQPPPVGAKGATGQIWLLARR